MHINGASLVVHYCSKEQVYEMKVCCLSCIYKIVNRSYHLTVCWETF